MVDQILVYTMYTYPLHLYVNNERVEQKTNLWEKHQLTEEENTFHTFFQQNFTSWANAVFQKLINKHIFHLAPAAVQPGQAMMHRHQIFAI
jgi:hypothetical protein